MRIVRLFFARTLLAMVGPILLGLFLSGWLGVDALFGGIERVSVVETKSCLHAAGAKNISVTKRGVTATTDGKELEGLVAGELRQGNAKVGVVVHVLEGDSLPPKIPFRYGVISARSANALVSWNSRAKRPQRLLDCIRHAGQT